eukprot:IDg10824t1
MAFSHALTAFAPPALRIPVRLPRHAVQHVPPGTVWRTAPACVTTRGAHTRRVNARPPPKRNNNSSSTVDGTGGNSAERRRRARKASKGELSNVGTSRPTIQWYPGHIAKAERQLQESLRAVDVVIEVRDSRAPISTAHPSVSTWAGARTHVVALSRADLCADAARRDWAAHLRDSGISARFVDARRGRGVTQLRRLAEGAGEALNVKRASRGLQPRAVRCIVVGYPNVGKSALINRLAGRRATRSANTPGVTRHFQWVRLAEGLHLLDMPGVIPMKLADQDIALRLAICDDIGHAAYDKQIAAALMIDELKRVCDALPEGYF